jgi:tetratricopeptide (TPR) repeat protein
LDRLLDFYLVSTEAAVSAAFSFDRDPQPRVRRTSPVAVGFDAAKAALAWLSTERANLVAAIRYAAGHDRPEHTWQLAVLLWRYFNTAGHLEDWIETLELAERTVSNDRENLAGQAYVLLRLSAVHWRCGRLTHALELAARALPKWVRLGDPRGEANTLCAIASPTMDLGDHDRAIAHFEAALAKYEEIGDARGQANVLSQLGYLNELHGHLELAERRQLAAVDLLRTIDHPRGLAHAVSNLGSVRQKLGRLEDAVVHQQEARALAVEIGDRSLEAYALNYLGNIHRLLGELDEAVHYQERARMAANAVSDANLRTQLYLDRGATNLARGEAGAALAVYRAALDLATGTGDRGHHAHASHGIARALHALGDHEPAAGFWRTARIEFTELKAPEAEEVERELEMLDGVCGRG